MTYVATLLLGRSMRLLMIQIVSWGTVRGDLLEVIMLSESTVTGTPEGLRVMYNDLSRVCQK